MGWALLYPSECSASSSGWPPGLGTNESPRTPSSRCRPAAPNQSPGSEQDVNGRRVHLTHTEEAGVVNALIARNKDSLVVFVRVPWAHSLRWRRDFLVWGPAEEIQKIQLHEAKGKWNTGYCVTQWAGHEAAQETRFIIRRVNNVYHAHRVYLKKTYPVNYTSRVNVL